MNLGTIRGRALLRLDDDTASPVAHTITELNASINDGQQLFALITLCYELQASFPLTANTYFYNLLSTYADWIVPLDLSDAAGNKIRPARLFDIEARNAAWKSAVGTPSKYDLLGFDFLVLNQHPSGSGTSITVTYAAAPPTLAVDSDVPVIPADFHPLLVEYAIYRQLEKAGDGSLLDALQNNLQKFLEGATQLAAQVRTRFLAQRYDKLPLEVERLDLSRLTTVRKDLLPTRKGVPS